MLFALFYRAAERGRENFYAGKGCIVQGCYYLEWR